jgi:hypothetical protein
VKHKCISDVRSQTDSPQVWNSEAEWKASQGNAIHEKVVAVFKELVDTSDPTVKGYHNAFKFNNNFDTIVKAPVVALTAALLPASADAAAFEATWNSILSEHRSSAPEGFVAGAHAFAINDVEAHPTHGDVKVFCAISGWESVEKNEAARQGMVSKFGELRKFTDVIITHHTTFSQ